MSFFTQWLAAWQTRNAHLERIASALERIAPLPEEPVELKPDEAVSYVDEEKQAQRDLAEEMHLLEQWEAGQAEQERELEADRGADVLRESH